MSLLGRCGVFAALILAVLLVDGCGDAVLDASKVEDQIKAEVEKTPQKKGSSVDCPSNVEVEPGEKFTCVVRLSTGDTETATLLIRDEDANLTFLNLQPDK